MVRPRAYADLREPTPIAQPVPARRAPLWLRPFGYALATAVWFLLFLICGGIMVFALPAAMSGTLDGQGLLHARMFQPSDWPVTVAVIAIAVVPVFGSLTYLLLAGTLGVFLSALTLLGRSLHPRYADERLSLSIWSRGETIGPPPTALTGTSLSLVPIRMTRWSKIATIISFNGFIPNSNMFVLGTVWGYGYFFTVTWLLWPASGTAAVICGIASLAIALALCWMAWHRRHRFPDVMPGTLQDTAYATSWPNSRGTKASGRTTKRKPASRATSRRS
ncbi:hypothetical protein IT072_20460 [Leifsonia sp. ZF2019]|uniref:hypothetical protein n=1 Tax=Leifsonia sp. ZF2019 TaxID=2781978 RepID=UPI001CC1206B|nr:hypothetical protein [Leifsonia sp. ZF2019]UAJ79519.1 hypothetical protein IT072_20460 [Leifsonia sp. ZF2019]